MVHVLEAMGRNGKRNFCEAVFHLFLFSKKDLYVHSIIHSRACARKHSLCTGAHTHTHINIKASCALNIFGEQKQKLVK